MVVMSREFNAYFLTVFIGLVFSLAAYANDIDSEIASIKKNITVKLSELQTVEGDLSSKQQKQEKLYASMLKKIKSLKDYQNQLFEYEELEKKNPQQLNAIKQQINQFNKKRDITVSMDNSLSELDSKASDAKSALEVLEVESSQLTQRIEELVIRPAQANKELLKAKQDLQKLLEQSVVESPSIEYPQQTLPSDVDTWADTIRRHRLSFKIQVLEVEKATHNTRLKYLEEQKLLNQSKKRYWLAQVDRIENTRSEKLNQELSSVNEEEKNPYAVGDDAAPRVQSLSKENQLLHQHLVDTQKHLREVEAKIDVESSISKQLDENYKNALKHQDSLLSRYTFSQILREQSRTLPSVDTYRERLIEREEKLINANARQIQNYRKRQTLQDIEQYVIGLSIEPDEDKKIKSTITKQLEQQVQLLSDIIKYEEKYIIALSELDFTEQTLLSTAAKFKDLIEENLLWERSSKIISLSEIASVGENILDIFDSKKWGLALVAMSLQFRINPFVISTLCFAAIFIYMRRNVIKHCIMDNGQYVRKPLKDNFLYTLSCLFWIAVYCLPWLLFPLGTGTK